MEDLKRCSSCHYFDRRRKYHDVFLERFSYGCNKCAVGYCSDCYDYANRLVFCGDKSCFEPHNQISMFKDF